MKKSSKIFAAALFALASFVPTQANELTVFDYTDQSDCVPMRGYYFDTQNYPVQTILPASELTAMEGAYISSMKFYIADATGNALTGGKMKVSIGSTTENSFYQSMITGLTPVAEVAMTNGETEVVVNFTEPWFYEGNNIVIETMVTETTGYKSVHFYGQNAQVNNAIYGVTYFSTAAFYPKTTFTYQKEANKAAVSTQAVAFGSIYLDQEATQKITLKNVGENAFTPVIGALDAPFTVEATPVELASGETMDIVVKFAAQAVGDYNATLNINCGAAGSFQIPVSATAAEAPAQVVVAQGDVYCENVPVNAMNFDRENSGNVSQMIYTADLLTDLVGKKINSITFQSRTANRYMANGNLQLSIKAVEEDAFASATPYTDMTVIANASPVNGEIVFNFTEPYQYNGGNIAIEVLVTEKGDYGVDKFYGIEKAGASYAYFWDLGYETHVYNYLPTATFGYVKEDAPQPQVIRGDVDGNEVVGISDVTVLIDLLLSGGVAPAAADCNLDGEVGIGDVTVLIDYLLSGNWSE